MKCPNCKRSDELYSVDLAITYTKIEGVNKYKELVYGPRKTQIVAEIIENKANEKGDPQLTCYHCGHTWYAEGVYA